MLYTASLILSAILSLFAGTRVAVSPGFRYVYVEDTLRKVCFERQSDIVHGTVDGAGNFVYEYTRSYGFYSGPMLNILNARGYTWHPCYEYRSGRLIPGTIKHENQFVPELSGRVTSFSMYVYDPNGPEIWNLPGEYMTWAEFISLMKAKPNNKPLRIPINR